MTTTANAETIAELQERVRRLTSALELITRVKATNYTGQQYKKALGAVKLIAWTVLPNESDDDV